jgi:hypothetical protein
MITGVRQNEAEFIGYQMDSDPREHWKHDGQLRTLGTLWFTSAPPRWVDLSRRPAVSLPLR